MYNKNKIELISSVRTIINVKVEEMNLQLIRVQALLARGAEPADRVAELMLKTSVENMQSLASTIERQACEMESL